MVLAVLVVCGLTTLAWLLRSQDRFLDQARVLEVRRGATQEPAVEESAAPAKASALNEVDPHVGMIEVCGVGWIEKKDDATSVDLALVAKLPELNDALVRMVSGLRQSPDDFTRAAAGILDMSRDPAVRGDASPLERIARDAMSSNDPRLYQLAFRLCERTPTAGSCALLGAAQWARIDEGNGAPWLFILADAERRGDQPAVEEALYRIGSAARFDDRFAALAGTIAVPDDAEPTVLMAAQMLETKLLGVAAALPMSYLSIMKLCRGDALFDANRRQSCDAVAAALAERSDTSMASTIGVAIGRRVGWPLERRVAVRALSVALGESWSAASGGAASPDREYSCDNVRGTLARTAKLAQVGEPQVGRDWIAQSGKPFESFALVGRKQEMLIADRDAQDAALASAVGKAASSASGSR